MPADAPQFYTATYQRGKSLYFSLYDGAAAVFLTGAALGAGNTLISVDGGAFGNTTNPGAEIGATGVYSLLLTAGETAHRDIIIKVTKAGTIADKLLHVVTYNDASATDQVLLAGLAQGAGTGTDTIQLDAGTASSVDDYYVGGMAIITDGNGLGQFGTIIGYTAATQDLQVSEDWITAVDNTSIYAILPGASVSISGANVWNTSEGAEPAGAIADNATFGEIVRYIKRYLFNNMEQTVVTRTMFKDDSTSPLTTQSVSYDGVTQVRGKGV